MRAGDQRAVPAHGALERADALQDGVERPRAEQHRDGLGVTLDVELSQQQADAGLRRGERAAHDGRSPEEALVSDRERPPPTRMARRVGPRPRQRDLGCEQLDGRAPFHRGH
jgi:hypothetical protein